MGQFIKPLEIRPYDDWKLLRLKKKFNQCACRLNCHCNEGKYLSEDDKIKLIHELYDIGNEINHCE